MPQANYLLLKELIFVLSKIKISTSNHLETYKLSVHMAPHVLWKPTCQNSLFGSDLSKKVRGSKFSLWEQSPHCDPGIENSLERSLMLKDTLGLHAIRVGDTLIYFRKDWEGRLIMLLERSDSFLFCSSVLSLFSFFLLRYLF